MGEQHKPTDPADAPEVAGERPPPQTGRLRAVSDAEHKGSGAPLDIPSSATLLNAVLLLNRQVSLEMHDEEIVHAFVDTLKELFPRRHFLVRLIVPGSGALALAYATGKLNPKPHDGIRITREALRRFGLTATALGTPAAEVLDTYVRNFTDTASGFDIPMLDGDRLVGVMGIEYPPDVDPSTEDRAIIAQLTLELAAALRNARLLRESVYLRDYVTKLLDHANAPIVVIGRHREIRVANQAFLALLDTTREDLLGGDFVRLLPEAERNRLLPVLVNAMRGRPTVNVELNLPRRGGGIARLVANMASILSADGEVEGVIAIGRDLTEVRQLEEQVIQAEKLATLGQLAAGVVHELNNPLTSISVYADYLLKKGQKAGAETGDVEKLRRIVQSAERILRFTRDLVTYARPSSEEPRLLSIHSELDQAIVFCEHVIAEAGARVDKRYDSSLPEIFGVKGQLHQVFINLVTNACHAMPEGAGRLVVETGRGEDDTLWIRVRDNGAGVPSGDFDRIFQPFFSTKGEGRGTGLGLSIVRNIVRQHGGDISVESTLGEGATFIVTLPIRQDSELISNPSY